MMFRPSSSKRSGEASVNVELLGEREEVLRCGLRGRFCQQHMPVGAGAGRLALCLSRFGLALEIVEKAHRRCTLPGECTARPKDSVTGQPSRRG